MSDIKKYFEEIEKQRLQKKALEAKKATIKKFEDRDDQEVLRTEWFNN